MFLFPGPAEDVEIMYAGLNPRSSIPKVSRITPAMSEMTS